MQMVQYEANMPICIRTWPCLLQNFAVHMHMCQYGHDFVYWSQIVTISVTIVTICVAIRDQMAMIVTFTAVFVHRSHESVDP